MEINGGEDAYVGEGAGVGNALRDAGGVLDATCAGTVASAGAGTGEASLAAWIVLERLAGATAAAEGAVPPSAGTTSGPAPTESDCGAFGSALRAETELVVASLVAMFTAAGVSKDPAEVGAVAMASDVSDPPHAASEMHSESTLSAMKRGCNAVGVIICGR